MRVTKMCILAVLALASCTPTLDTAKSEDSVEAGASPCDWPQQFGTPSHTGKVCAAQHNLQVVAMIEADADADAENLFSGFLQIHPGSAITSGDYIVLPHSYNFNEGGITDATGISTKKYDTRVYRWVPGVDAPVRVPVLQWTSNTDWEPIDVAIASFGVYTNGYVQAFQPVVSGGSVYIPRKSGMIERRVLSSGALEATINPFAGTVFDGDPLLLQAAALAVSPTGQIVYTVTAYTEPFGADPRNAFLVEVTPGNPAHPTQNVVRLQPWARLTPAALGIPQTNDLCARPFFLFGRSPVGPDDHTNMAKCGAQRPALNAPVAWDSVGNLYVTSYASRELSAQFIVRINASSLAPQEALDTRGHLHNGCGVRIPLSDPDCQILTANGTTQIGIDPDYNTAVRFQGGDLMDSAPTIAPDKAVSIGGYTGGFTGGGGFDARGAGMAFDGNLVHVNEEFFWEVTSGVFPATSPGGAFSYTSDLNRYSDNDLNIARWSPTFSVLSQGSIGEQNPNAVAGDWLDTQPALNADSSSCGINAQGVFACFAADGSLTESVDILDENGDQLSMETLSNHTARDRAGDYLTIYAGKLVIIAGGGPTVARRSLRPSVGVAAKLALSRAAKQAALASVGPPPL